MQKKLLIGLTVLSIGLAVYFYIKSKPKAEAVLNEPSEIKEELEASE